MGKFLPRTALTNDSSYLSTANQSAMLFFRDDATTNYGGAHLRYTVDANGNSAPYLSTWSDWSGAPSSNYTIDANKEVQWFANKTTTSFSFIVYQEGVYKGTHTISLSETNEINRLFFGVTTKWNGTYYDINIYDEVLTTTEIEQLLKTKGSIKQSGNFLVKQINELGDNLWPLTELSTSISYTVSGHGTVSYQNDELGEYHQTTFTNTDGVYKGFDITTISGKYYVFSGWFWQSSGNTFDYCPCVIEHEESGTETRNGTFSNSPYEEWFYGWSIAQAGSTGNLRCLIYPMRVGYNGSGTLKWRNISFREATPTEIKMINNGTFQCGDLSDF
jgi:hypothetical protein